MADVLGEAQGMRSQRKRKKVSYSSGGVTTSPLEDKGQETLLSLASNCSKLVVFSGSGLSAGSGMSTFSTKGGLYERAQKRFHVTDGKRLFTYSFYEKRKLEALAFFADIYGEARKAKPGLGHKALAQIANAHKLVRHYTMNIDGLAEAAGMDTWHVDNNPTGLTVEMHGNINQLVCPLCGVVVMMTPALLTKLRSKKAIPCTKCDCEALRCRIMLYDDGEDDVITPEDVFDLMEEDVQQADLVLWIGISFEQSASTAYFRRVRQYLMEGNRQDLTSQAVINITEEAVWNLMSACSNKGSMDVLEVLGSSDVILPMLVTAMSGPTPTPSAPASTSHTDPLQGGSRRRPACQNGVHDQPAKGTHSAAIKDQAPQQTTTAAAVQSGQPTGGTVQDEDQLQHESSHASAGQAWLGPDESSGHLQTAPHVLTPGLQSQNARKEEPPHAASGKPGEESQEETPNWLRPIAPLLPDAERQPSPSSQGKTSTYQQHRRQQHQRHKGHTMQAGLALTTMCPPCIAEDHLQQGYGQIAAPVDQQQLPQHSGMRFGDSDSRLALNSVVAPVHIQCEREEADQMDTCPIGASQQINAGSGACGANQAAAPAPELNEMRDHPTSSLSLLTASGTGLSGCVSAPEHQQAEHAQHDRQAQHVQHDAQAQHAQNDPQACWAQGEQPVHHSASELAQTHTSQQADQTQQAANQPKGCTVVQDQRQQDSCQGNGHSVAGHSGIVPGEPAVSSREHAQRHLLNATPLPWQQPGQDAVAKSLGQQK